LLNLIDKGATQMHRWIDAPGPTQVAASPSQPSTRVATAATNTLNGL
jgi:hypothetical protein